MKKNICKGLLLVMLVAVLAGCEGDTKQQDPVMQSVSTTAPTAGSLTTVPTTVPTVSTTPAPTTGTVTVPSPQSTTAPTSPSGEVTLPTSVPTMVPTTAPTTVPTTVTTQPGHVCNLVAVKTVAATCTDGAFVVRSCSCGKTVQDITSKPLGHKYGEWYTVSEATCVANRKEARKCERCGDEKTRTVTGTANKWTDEPNDHENCVFLRYRPNSPWGCEYNIYKCKSCNREVWDKLAPELTGEAASAWLREAEAATLKYLNQYRAEIGSPEMTMLPGLSEVMRYRAKQYQDNWYSHAHDQKETVAAFDLFQYGEYTEPDWTEAELEAFKQAGVTPSFDPHYYPLGAEAACHGYGMEDTPDQCGYAIATALRNSEDHWRYLKLAEWTYAGVGFRYAEGYGDAAYVWVTNKDYDAISAGR